MRTVGEFGQSSSAINCTALLVMLVAAGCGTSTSEPQPVPDPQAAAPPVKKPEADKPPTGPDFSKFPASNVFEISDTPATNFAVIGTGAEHPADSIFAATSGAASNDSHFALPSRANATRSRIDPSSGLPAGFVAVSELESSDTLPKRIRCELDGSEMVLVPAGEFVIGSSNGPPETRPATRLHLDAFYIGLHEVTVADFHAVRKKLANKASTFGEPLNASDPGNFPVLGLVWGEARNLAKATGRELPTEAQWEKAARGENGFQFPWGNSRPLWRAPRTPDQIEGVASHDDDRSPYGIMDMAGNAREWTLDFFQENALLTLSDLPPDRRRNWTGPRNTMASSVRVIKGNGSDWSVWARRGAKMAERHPQVGFRCVLNLSADSTSK